ncbi:MAG: prolyl oligopeptidase family serine peptidase [Bacteroidetes bacterium]|nr:prolyl oligopeptidase family serine peptidase [Bacteroidota bacterium]
MKRFFLIALAFIWISTLHAARHQKVFQSSYLEKPDTTWIFTPSGYEKQAAANFPVVYLLHGWSGNYHQWDDIMDCQKYADQYGFIIICPDGLYDAWYLNSPVTGKSQYKDFFFRELVPAMEKGFRIDRQNVFITGLSMGGHGALYLFSQKPQIFKNAGSLSGAVDLRSCRNDYEIPGLFGLKNTSEDDKLLLSYSVIGNIEKIAATGKEIIFSCGTEDQFYKNNTDLKAKMDALGIKSTFIVGPGGHNYPYWKANIGAQMKFFADRVKPAVKEVLIMQHSHLDVGFTHLQPVALALQVDYINQALDMLDHTANYPEESRPKWTCEVTRPVVLWLETASDKDIQKFGDYLKAGRICISALEYNTTPLASSEGLARQVYDAAEISKRFGVKINTANLHDATGLPRPIVDILKDAGVDLLTFAINLHLSGTPKPRPAVYRWQSPGGRELLVMNGEHYSMFDQWTNDNYKNLDTIQDGLDRYLSYVSTLDYPYDFIYLTATCAPSAYDNSPPNFDLPAVVKKWNEEGRLPHLRFATPKDLLARIREIPYDKIPVVKGDWTDYWNFGSASSATETQISLNTASNMGVIDLLSAFGTSNKQLDQYRKKIWYDLNFYDEHTWGAWNPLDIHDPFPTSQWNMKANAAYDGMALSKFSIIRYLQQLAGNPRTYDTLKGVLLVNPTSAETTVYPRIPDEWFIPGKQIETWLMGGDRFERAPKLGKFYSPVKLEPYSWKKIPFSQLKEARPDVAISSGMDFIETAYYKLKFDPGSGKVVSLFDKKKNREILDVTSSYGFFQFVHEKPDPAVDSLRRAFHVRSVENERIGLTGWQTGWKAAYSTISQAVCKVETTPFTATLLIKAKAESTTGIEQRIILHADSPMIDLETEFVKTENVMPEGIYFVFPLALEAGWKGYFDTGDVPVELDNEQLAGSCHGWETVSSFASIHDKLNGASLFCPDAPLVMFGGFNFGRKLAVIPRDKNPLLLAWATNNYWETNFRGSQPGLIRLRYAFRPQGSFDPVDVSKEAQMVISPVIVHPVAETNSSASGQFINIQTPGIRATYVKESEDNTAKIIRLVNLTDQVKDAGFELPGSHYSSAWRCGTTEDKMEVFKLAGNLITVKLQPREITSIRVE